MAKRHVHGAVVAGVLAVAVTTGAIAQEGADEQPFYHHRLGFYTGNTLVSAASTGVQDDGLLIIPTIGLSYEFFFTPRVGLGVTADLELQNYVIEAGEADELERDRNLIITAIVLVEPVERFALFAGAGGEFEKNENFFVVRVGTAYAFRIGRSWELAIEGSYDYKDVYGSWGLGLVIVKLL